MADVAAPLEAVLALARWQQTRRGYDGDAALISTGLALLSPGENGHFPALKHAESAFNVSWQRIAAEVTQFAVFLVTKAKRDDEARPDQVKLGLRLLRLALTAFAVKKEAPVSLSVNSCNLLLSALAESLEKTGGQDRLHSLLDVKYIFVHLFGLPQQLEEDVDAAPGFQLYRPPTNVFADFMNRALTAAFKEVDVLTETVESEEEEECKARVKEIVALADAIVRVYQELQKSQMNKKKVFLAVAKTSLRSIVRFRYNISRWTVNRFVDGASAILQRLDQTIEDALFDAEHIREFDGALVHQRSVWQQETYNNNGQDEDGAHSGKKSKKRRHNERAGGKQTALISYQKQLFDELLALLSDSEVSTDIRATGVGAFMNVLMRGFSIRIRAAASSKIFDAKSDPKTSRKRAAVVIAATSTTFSPFKFWAELSAVAFLAFQQQSTDQTDATPSVDKVTVLVELLDSLFRSLREYDVYRVTEDTEDQEQFTTMEKVLSSFFSWLPSDISGILGESESALQKISEMRCSIVSSAVNCSPNLANCCCTAILETLGAQAYHAQVNSASKTVVDLVQAYDSMRLLDKLLSACFSVTSDAGCAEGLYMLLAHPTCELRFRKAFLALPPGQVDVTWQLFINEASKYSSKSDNEAQKLSNVRLLFQTFMQEIYVTPVNRTKIVGLVTKTLDALVDPVAERIYSNGCEHPLSFFEHEICRVFGELLMFYSAAKAASASATELVARFETVIEKLGGNGDKFVTVVEVLLALSSKKKHEKKGGAKHMRASRELSDLSLNGMNRAGVIKICVHWLRQTSKLSGTPNTNRVKKITHLVIDFVVQTHCWDAIAFYLPDVLEGSSQSSAQNLLGALIVDYVAENAISSDLSPVTFAPTRILFDAAFYEIQNVRLIAPAALVSITKDLQSSMQVATDLTAPRKLDVLYSLLLRIPTGYLDLPKCGSLLFETLGLYKNLIEKGNGCAVALTQLSRWLQVYFGPISTAAFPSSKDLPSAFEEHLFFIFQHDSITNMDYRALAPMIATAVSHGKDNDAFDRMLSADTAAKTRSKYVDRAITVIQALALVHRKDQSTQCKPAEANTVKKVMTMLQTSDGIGIDNLHLLRALITYQASLKGSNAGKRGQHHNEADAYEFQTLLSELIGPALASTLKNIASNPSRELSTSSWAFFATCCEEYPTVRNSFVNDVKGFGLLLATALAALGNSFPRDQSSLDIATKPVYNLVHAANKSEFRLLIATLQKEASAPEAKRKLSALIALCEVLSGGKGERKPSASRRQCFTDFKELLLSVLVENVGELQLSLASQELQIASEAVVWNLKALMLLFCKAELFTWKAHELAQAFSAFDVLYFAASPIASDKHFSLHQLDSIWTSSYSLLLRIVRHHFASVVNCIPHLVQATNALLQIVVTMSSTPTSTKLESSPRWPLLAEWTSNLARLFGYMKEHDSQLRKHVVYLIMPFLIAASRGELSVSLQQKLRPGVFALLDMCSLYEKEQLYAALDTSGKSLLKTLDTSYKLTYRYAGKV